MLANIEKYKLFCLRVLLVQLLAIHWHLHYLSKISVCILPSFDDTNMTKLWEATASSQNDASIFCCDPGCINWGV